MNCVFGGLRAILVLRFRVSEYRGLAGRWQEGTVYFGIVGKMYRCLYEHGELYFMEFHDRDCSRLIGM